MSAVNDPLVLLQSKEDRQGTAIGAIWNPFLGSVLGFGAAAFSNWGLRKPVFSGIQKHIAFTLIGGALGLYFDKQRDAYLAKKDAVLRHYVELHPDDFPVEKRVKYGEILERWVPIR